MTHAKPTGESLDAASWEPFVADAAIVVLTRGAPRRPLRTGTRIGHLVSRLFAAGV